MPLDAGITALDTISTDVLHVISHVGADLLPNVSSWHNLDVSSGILQGAGIYHLMGEYYSLQS